MKEDWVALMAGSLLGPLLPSFLLTCRPNADHGRGGHGEAIGGDTMGDAKKALNDHPCA